MVFEMRFVRSAYAQVLAHEVKKVVRMLRSIPADRFDVRGHDCGWTARELAEGMVTHLRRIDSLANRSAPCRPPRGPRTRGAMLLDLETHFLGASAAIERLPSERWGEVVSSPLDPRMRARRGELLWLALREMVRHDRHFALHLQGGCPSVGRGEGDGGSRVLTREPIEPTLASA